MTYESDNLSEAKNELARLKAEAAFGQLIAEDLRHAQWLREGKISLTRLARSVAYEAVGSPKRLMTADQDRTYYEVFRNFVRQMKYAIRFGQLVTREPITMMPIAVIHLESWLEADETMLSCDAMCPHDRIVIRVDNARMWLSSLGAKTPAVLAEHCPESLEASGRRSMPPIAWHTRLIEHWPNIVRRYGASVQARVAMRYVKLHDRSGVILSYDVADELKWRTQLGDTKIIGLKTFKNTLSALRKRGYLKT